MIWLNYDKKSSFSSFGSFGSNTEIGSWFGCTLCADRYILFTLWLKQGVSGGFSDQVGYQSGMKNYPHLQLQLKNQSYVPMAPVPDFSCCVGFINLEIGNRRNSGILIHIWKIKQSKIRYSSIYMLISLMLLQMFIL